MRLPGDKTPRALVSPHHHQAKLQVGSPGLTTAPTRLSLTSPGFGLISLGQFLHPYITKACDASLFGKFLENSDTISS